MISQKVTSSLELQTANSLSLKLSIPLGLLKEAILFPLNWIFEKRAEGLDLIACANFSHHFLKFDVECPTSKRVKPRYEPKADFRILLK